MVHNILKSIGGIEQYGTASLCLFATIFAAVFVWALLQRKGHLDRMSRVPLEEDPADSSLTERNAHE